jgi:hypothetical protein
MLNTEQLFMVKMADAFTPVNVFRSLPDKSMALGAGIAGTMPFIPWDTFGALRDKLHGTSHNDDLGRGMVSDTGRGIGAALGGGAIKGLTETWHIPRTSRLANLAMILGGMGVGGFLGQRQGNQIGQELFPGSFSDRLRRSYQNLNL